MTNIIIGVHPERPTHPAFMDDLWTLTQRCWERKPQDRPAIDSIVGQLSVPQSAGLSFIHRKLQGYLPGSTKDFDTVTGRAAWA